MAASPFHKDDEAAAISDVNVVPLADVSLVLLIILLVLSPMAAQSMLKVQAAALKAEAVPPTPFEMMSLRDPEPVIVLGVSPHGFVVDGKLLAAAAEAAEHLKLKLSMRTDRKVFVTPELDVAHGQVIAALEAVQEAGGTPALVQVVDPEPR